MPRIYKTKPKCEKLVHNPTVPMTEGMLAALRKAATQAGVSTAEKARELIEMGLRSGDRK